MRYVDSPETPGTQSRRLKILCLLWVFLALGCSRDPVHSELKHPLRPKGKSGNGCNIVERYALTEPLPSYLAPLVNRLCSAEQEQDCKELRSRVSRIARRDRRAELQMLVDACFTQLLPHALHYRDLNFGREKPLDGGGPCYNDEIAPVAEWLEKPWTSDDPVAARAAVAAIRDKLATLDRKLSSSYFTRELSRTVLKSCSAALENAIAGRAAETVTAYLSALQDMSSFEGCRRPLRFTAEIRSIEALKRSAMPVPHSALGGYLAGPPELNTDMRMRSAKRLGVEGVSAAHVGIPIEHAWLPEMTDLRAFESGLEKYLRKHDQELADLLDNRTRLYAGIVVEGHLMLHVDLYWTGIYGCSGCGYDLYSKRKRVDSIFFDINTGSYCGLTRWW